MDDNQKELIRLEKEMAELEKEIAESNIRLDRLERQLLNVANHIATNVSYGLIRRVQSKLNAEDGTAE